MKRPPRSSFPSAPQPRKPRGTPTGGQFAGIHRSEAYGELVDTEEVESDTGNGSNNDVFYDEVTVGEVSLGCSFDRAHFVASTPGGQLVSESIDLDKKELRLSGLLRINGVQYRGTVLINDGELRPWPVLVRIDESGRDIHRGLATDAARDRMEQWSESVFDAIQAHPARDQVLDNAVRAAAEQQATHHENMIARIYEEFAEQVRRHEKERAELLSAIDGLRDLTAEKTPAEGPQRLGFAPTRVDTDQLDDEGVPLDFSTPEGDGWGDRIVASIPMEARFARQAETNTKAQFLDNPELERWVFQEVADKPVGQPGPRLALANPDIMRATVRRVAADFYDRYHTERVGSA